MAPATAFLMPMAAATTFGKTSYSDFSCAWAPVSGNLGGIQSNPYEPCCRAREGVLTSEYQAILEGA
jgi:hypothetical protein